MNGLNRKLFFNHLGEIYFRIAIVGIFVTVFMTLAGVMAMLVTVVLFLLLVVLVLCTVGLILLARPDIFSLINFEKAGEIANFAVGTIAPIASIVTLVSAVLCLVCLSFGEPKKHKGKIIFSAVLLGAAAILVAVAFSAAAGRA